MKQNHKEKHKKPQVHSLVDCTPPLLVASKTTGDIETGQQSGGREDEKTKSWQVHVQAGSFTGKKS